MRSHTAPHRHHHRIAVVGAGPVGLALALLAAEQLPQAEVSLFDARPLDKDVSADPRTLALSLGSVQLLQRLRAWPADQAQAIREVRVSQQPPSLGHLLGGALERLLGPAEVAIRAEDEGVAMLGAVLRYGRLTAALQARWQAVSAAEPTRLFSRFGQPVAAITPRGPHSVEIDAGVVEDSDLVVVAEGGVFSDRVRRVLGPGDRPPLQHDYQQTAWVGTVQLPQARPGVAYERFTRHGPVALLPLGPGEAALVWCVPSSDDPVAPLDATQRQQVLASLLPPEVGPLTGLSALKAFPLGLLAERSLTEGRMVRIGNAAQTLHPVAGQGLNLGLRDAFVLVQSLSRSADVDAVLRRLEWQRGPDRWAMIAATDFLARSFTWQLPGAAPARGLGLAAVQRLSPLRSLLARQMMFGSR